MVCMKKKLIKINLVIYNLVIERKENLEKNNTRKQYGNDLSKLSVIMNDIDHIEFVVVVVESGH